MKQIIIKKENQSLTINQKGAEITSWKINNQEFIYQKNDFWKKQAPILFPFVGDDNKEKLLLNEKKISFSKHGYCRGAFFKIEAVKKNEATLSFDINQIEANYFLKLFVTFKLEEKNLKVEFKVKNNGEKKSAFQLGWHPAFIIKNDQYQLFVDNDFSLKLDQENFLTNKKITILKNLFPNFNMQESLIIPTKVMEIKSSNHKIMMQSNFDYGILWHQKHSNFLCLEPWTSPCSKKNDNIDLLKRDNIKIAPDETKTYFVKVKIWS